MSKKIKSKPKDMAQSKKKTKTRSLPINELVIISERFEVFSEDSDIETANEEKTTELSEDPISQLTSSLGESHSEVNGKKNFRQLDIASRRDKRFGTIDISEFRMPKVRAGAQHGTPSHSDGFIGHEAVPIGNVMPVRKQNRRQQMWNKITVRMGELTLVAERPYDEVPDMQNQAHHRKKAVEKPRNHSDWVEDFERQELRAHDDAEISQEDAPMLVDIVSEQQGAKREVPKHSFGSEELPQKRQGELSVSREQNNPQILTPEISVLELPIKSFPLEQKEQRKPTRNETNGSPSQVASTQSRGSIGRREENHLSVSQEPKMISAFRKVDKPEKTEIEVSLQLMMVTIPRSSVRDSDSEDSDSEQHEEDMNESEENSDNDEDERSDASDEDWGGGCDDTSETEAQDEDVEMINQDDGIPGSHDLLKHVEFPSLSSFEGQTLPTKVTIPTLCRQDAQNPIFEMSPEKQLTGRQMSLKSAIRRRPSTIQQHQAAFSDDLSLDKMTDMAVDQLQDKDNSGQFRISGPAREKDRDYAWRPRVPMPSIVLMEVEDDEILDPPTPVQASQPSSNDIRISSRRLSQISVQALQLVASRPGSPQQHVSTSEESQGSIELGDTQRFVWDSQHSSIPETQLSNPKQQTHDAGGKEGDEEEEEEEEEEREVSLSQLVVITESSYFQQALQSLQEPMRKPGIVRAKSMPASMHTSRHPEKGDSIADGMPRTDAFGHSILPRPPKSSGGMDSSVNAAPGKSLSMLTRQARRGLGRLSTTARGRMISLPFVPPFKKQQ